LIEWNGAALGRMRLCVSFFRWFKVLVQPLSA
jgi:hypothetical protein